MKPTTNLPGVPVLPGRNTPLIETAPPRNVPGAEPVAPQAQQEPEKTELQPGAVASSES